MPETEVEQPTSVAPVVVVAETLAVKEDKLAAEEDATKTDDGSEKKDEEKKEDKVDEEKKKKTTSADKKKKEAGAAPPAPAVHKKDFEKDVVYLYQFNRTSSLPSVSPYCLKVETWLKLNNIKYQNVEHNGKLRSKRGLLPFIELNGEEICDSEIIIATLSKKFEKEMDENLSTEQKNIQHAMITMVQNHLQCSVGHWFTKSADNMIKGLKLNLQSVMGSKLPNGILNFVFKHTYLRKGLKKVKSASFAGYTDSEIEAAGMNDLKVLSEMLGDKQFFFGDEPHTLDLVTFVQLASIMAIDTEVVECNLKNYINTECTNLVGLYNRMKDLAWGDHWDEATGSKMEMNPHLPKPEPVKEEAKKEESNEEAKEKADENVDKEKGDNDEKEKEEEKKEEKK